MAKKEKRKKDKKPFKETALFQTLKTVAPAVLDTVTDVAASVYPPLSVVDKLVDKAIGVAKDEGNASGAAVLYATRDDYASELELYYQDLSSARQMYQETDHTQADKIADNVIRYNLIIVMAMVLIQVLVIMYVEGQIAAVVTGVVGTVTGALLNERSTVINFFFGSSMGSKDKDKKI
jgi:hypothetical protein